MFERFTDHARKAIKDAAKASEEFDHKHVGTEHILLALLRSDGGIAVTVLTSAGLSAERIHDDILRFLGQDEVALESIGIDLEAVRARVEETFGPGALDELDPPPRRGWFRRRPATARWHRPFSPRAKKVCELSLREALALRHNYIGTEHLLLGLLREGNGLAAKLLADAGLDFAQLREQTIAAIPAR